MTDGMTSVWETTYRLSEDHDRMYPQSSASFRGAAPPCTGTTEQPPLEGYATREPSGERIPFQALRKVSVPVSMRFSHVPLFLRKTMISPSRDSTGWLSPEVSRVRRWIEPVTRPWLASIGST